jgi:hypothetical protein
MCPLIVAEVLQYRLRDCRNPKHRNHLMGDINLLDQDDTARVGGNDQEMKVLNEMNEIQQFENDVWSPRRE